MIFQKKIFLLKKSYLSHREQRVGVDETNNTWFDISVLFSDFFFEVVFQLQMASAFVIALAITLLCI